MTILVVSRVAWTTNVAATVRGHPVVPRLYGTLKFCRRHGYSMSVRDRGDDRGKWLTILGHTDHRYGDVEGVRRRRLGERETHRDRDRDRKQARCSVSMQGVPPFCGAKTNMVDERGLRSSIYPSKPELEDEGRVRMRAVLVVSENSVAPGMQLEVDAGMLRDEDRQNKSAVRE